MSTPHDAPGTDVPSTDVPSTDVPSTGVPGTGSGAPALDDLVVHPQRIRWVAGVTAVVVVVVFSVVASLLRGDGTGVSFRPADQIAMVLLGVLLGGAALLLARPRVRVGADGVGVRNILGERLFPWEVVLDVSFPDGASFARLELPQDEYHAVMAIQAADGDRAVEAIQGVRALHRRHAGGAAGPAAGTDDAGTTTSTSTVDHRTTDQQETA